MPRSTLIALVFVAGFACTAPAPAPRPDLDETEDGGSTTTESSDPGRPVPDAAASRTDGGRVAEAPGSACAGDKLPDAVASMLKARCLVCHGATPLDGVPASLATYADLMKPAKSDPRQTVARVSLARLRGSSMPMPPKPAPAPAPAEIEAFAAWVEGPMRVGCPEGGVVADGGPRPGDGGAAVDAGPDPFASPPVCTSGTTWTGGKKGSPLMQPGEACITCHAKEKEGPRLAFAGTVYPSAHEPSGCNGANGTKSASGAQVIVVDALNVMYAAAVNAAGNFRLEAKGATVTPPLRAKVVFMGRERAMLTPAPSGDCNLCHTQAGAKLPGVPVPAPGRILLP